MTPLPSIILQAEAFFETYLWVSSLVEKHHTMQGKARGGVPIYLYIKLSNR